MPSDRPEPCSEHRLEPLAGGSDRQGGLVGGPGSLAEGHGDVRGGRVHPAEIGLVRVVDEERHHHHHRIAVRDGGRGVRRCREGAGRDNLAELLEQMRLSRERLGAGVDGVHRRRIHIRPDDPVAARGILHGQRQPDLAEPHNGDVHAFSMSVIVCAEVAEATAASATTTVSSPCCIVTISTLRPSTASRKFWCSTSRGSGFAMP